MVVGEEEREREKGVGRKETETKAEQLRCEDVQSHTHTSKGRMARRTTHWWEKKNPTILAANV
jgi:hypothetical protein